MLRRAGVWHAIAAEFARAALLPPAQDAGPVAAAVVTTAADPPRTVL